MGGSRWRDWSFRALLVEQRAAQRLRILGGSYFNVKRGLHTSLPAQETWRRTPINWCENALREKSATTPRHVFREGEPRRVAYSHNGPPVPNRGPTYTATWASPPSRWWKKPTQTIRSPWSHRYDSKYWACVTAGDRNRNGWPSWGDRRERAGESPTSSWPWGHPTVKMHQNRPLRLCLHLQEAANQWTVSRSLWQLRKAAGIHPDFHLDGMGTTEARTLPHDAERTELDQGPERW